MKTRSFRRRTDGNTEAGSGLPAQCSSVQLAYPDASLNQAAIIEISSIRSLAGMNVNNLMHSALFHGLYSPGTMFAARGYAAVPGIAGK